MTEREIAQTIRRAIAYAEQVKYSHEVFDAEFTLADVDIAALRRLATFAEAAAQIVGQVARMGVPIALRCPFCHTAFDDDHRPHCAVLQARALGAFDEKVNGHDG